MNLLDLPYDIRHKIYEHVFPTGHQFYIQAVGDLLVPMTQDYLQTTGLFYTCKALNTEGSEYLYNGYLFNIIGTKQDCLSTYRRFLDVMKRHARNEVHVDAFSNGSHSQTMCISIQAGEGRMAMMKRRERGEWVEIHALEKEYGISANRRDTRRPGATSMSRSFILSLQIAGAIIAILFAFLAMRIA